MGLFNVAAGMLSGCGAGIVGGEVASTVIKNADPKLTPFEKVSVNVAVGGLSILAAEGAIAGWMIAAAAVKDSVRTVRAGGTGRRQKEYNDKAWKHYEKLKDCKPGSFREAWHLGALDAYKNKYAEEVAIYGRAEEDE